jgi:hypothetical protein
MLVGLTVLMLLAGCGASTSPTPTQGAAKTTSMTTARAAQTATLLPDGRVLIVGGDIYAGQMGEMVQTSAELYDPKTGTFSRTGSLVGGRFLQTATLLPDGRVLIVGGPSGFGHPADAELYDPTTGTFSRTGSLATARDFQTATLLSDGRVLVAGGSSSFTDGPVLASAEVYDPKTGKFSPTGSLTTARSFQTATLLPDGRVLITGGTGAAIGVTFVSTTPCLASAELYDPKTGTFSATGAMSTGRCDQTATLLTDGRVLIVGGESAEGGTSLASAEIYDPKTGTFSPTGSLATARGFFTATLLSDGRVLIAGGQTTSGGSLASAEIYDPKTGTFSATGALATARLLHTATLLPDGRVLVAGGYDSGYFAGDSLASAEIYDPKTGTFSAAGS